MRRKDLKKLFLMSFGLLFTLGSTGLCAQELPDVVTGMHNGRPTVFINGVPDALPGYCPWYTEGFYENFIDRLYEHDMGLFFIALKNFPRDPGSSRFWKGDRIDSTPIFESPTNVLTLDKQAEHHLRGKPDAWIMVRFRHSPPKSWRDLHPAEFFIDEEGIVHDTPSLASDLFWEKASEFCGALITYCESRPWAGRIIGYMNIHLAEGIHLPVAEGFLFDHNPSMVHKWRSFLREKYGTVEKLRDAYGDDSLTFETMRIPRDKLRGGVNDVMNMLYWQNAADNGELRDYLELQRDLWHLRFRQISAGM